MEIVDHEDDARHGHRWLEKLGLQEAPPGPDSWIAVVRAIKLDNPPSSSSRVAARLTAALEAAGIEARSHLYEVDGPRMGTRGIPNGMVGRLAVLVRQRDVSRAAEVARGIQHELTDDQRGRETAPAVSEDELAQEALEAGPPPED